MSAYTVHICFAPQPDRPARREAATCYADLSAAFQHGLQSVEFSSRFGLARVTPASALMPVRSISSDLPEVQAHLVDMDIAEQLTLITGNRFALASTVWPIDGNCFVRLHVAPGEACVCAVEIERFDCATSAERMLDYLNTAEPSLRSATW